MFSSSLFSVNFRILRNPSLLVSKFLVFLFSFLFLSFQVFFFDIFRNVMGEFHSVITVSEHDVDTFAQCSFV